MKKDKQQDHESIIKIVFSNHTNVTYNLLKLIFCLQVDILIYRIP